MKNIYRHIFRAFLVIGLFIIGEGVMWGTTTYYARLKTSTTQTGSTGGGTAYVSVGSEGVSGSATSADGSGESSGDDADVTFSIKATAAAEYHFTNWSVSGGTYSIDSATSDNTTVNVKAKSTSSGAPTTFTATANFAENFYAYLSLNSDGTTVTPTGGGYGNVPSTSDKVQYNISTTTESGGYHFTKWTTKNGVSFGSTTSANTTASVSPATTGGKASAKAYDATANYIQNHYYSTVTLSIYSEKADGSGSVTINDNTAQIVEGSPYTSYSTVSGSSGGTITCNLKYLTAANGWHFAQWNKGTSPGTCSFGSNTATETTYTAKTPDTYDDDNVSPYSGVYNYTIQCKFVENYYTKVTTAVKCGDDVKGGKAYVTYGTTIGEDITTTTADDGYGQTYAREVSYAVRAVPDAGYHFVGWTIDNTSESTIVSPSNTTSQLKVKAVKSKQGASNPNAFKITANFEKDMYNAKLSTSVSSASEPSSSVAQVSSNNTNWFNNVTISADKANTDVTFYVKATPATGYKFIGWSETDGSSITVSGLGATGTYKVKSATTQGDTNATNLYAIFKKEYSIVINANGTSSTNRVVFNVTGPATYRVSVPIGSSLTLKDVTPGTYTITPETSWNWSYSVTPDSQTTSYDSVNKSTHNFTVTPKSTTTKHSEALNTLEY